MTDKHPPPRRPDPTDVSACTCANLRKAARVVTQAYNDALRPFDLRSTQFSLLAALAKTGDLPLTSLADALVMDRTTLTRNLKPMQRHKLIHIGQDKDQRVRMVSLTETGRGLFDSALPEWERMQLHISGKLGRDRWSGFLADLEMAVSVIRE